MNVKGAGVAALMTNRVDGAMQELALSPPIGFDWTFKREPRSGWKPGDTGLQYDQHIALYALGLTASLLQSRMILRH